MSRVLGLLACFAVVVGACGIPLDGEPRALDVATPTPVEEVPTPTASAIQLFTIYLTDAEGRVRAVERELPDPLTITALIDELRETPTEEETEQGLVTLIPAETELFAPPEPPAGGTAVIDLASGSLDTLEDDFLTLAVAQFVWTLTGSPSIDRVVIRIDGEDQFWPTDGEDKQRLVVDDYASFDPEFVEPTPEPVPSEQPSEEDGGG
ncbi:MAG: GerMN domain-containing protein [Actinomycetota bacterium]